MHTRKSTLVVKSGKDFIVGNSNDVLKYQRQRYWFILGRYALIVLLSLMTTYRVATYVSLEKAQKIVLALVSFVTHLRNG